MHGCRWNIVTKKVVPQLKLVGAYLQTGMIPREHHVGTFLTATDVWFLYIVVCAMATLFKPHFATLRDMNLKNNSTG